MAQDYLIVDLCLVLGVPRSSYYAWCQRPPSRRARQNEVLRTELASLFAANRKVYGSPRLAVCLQRAGIPCSRNRAARHMRALNLKARTKRVFRPKTTEAKHDQPIAPNRLAQLSSPQKTDRIWVGDITYVDTAQGWLYLAAVMDLYSRKIRRLGQQRLLGDHRGQSGLAIGLGRPPSVSRLAPSLRPRLPVCQRSLPDLVKSLPDPTQHERRRPLL